MRPKPLFYNAVLYFAFALTAVGAHAQSQLPAEYEAHLKAAKDAARFDW
jgi:hypothetical protein